MQNFTRTDPIYQSRRGLPLAVAMGILLAALVIAACFVL
jgi:hypothetical protein